MITDPQKQGCHLWAYEPAVFARRYAGTVAEKRKAVEQSKIDREIIRSAGIAKSALYGLTLPSATGTAQAIENATGVEMRVFSHTYL